VTIIDRPDTLANLVLFRRGAVSRFKPEVCYTKRHDAEDFSCPGLGRCYPSGYCCRLHCVIAEAHAIGYAEPPMPICEKAHPDLSMLLRATQDPATGQKETK
jgi:hypothetical protein